MSEEVVGDRQEAGEKRSGSSLSRLVGVVVIIAAIVAGGYFLMNQGGKAVAVVNGEKVSLAEYNERYARLVASVVSQGKSATTTEMQTVIKNQTLDNLVTETLLLQAANKEGLKANDQEIATQLSQNKSRFTEAGAFEKALSAEGYTESTFKDTLTRSNIIQQYLAAHINVSSTKATSAEVKALYDQVAATDKTVPPLEKVRTQVENQIVQQKQQQLITGYIQQLRASSTVEILLK